MSDVSLKIKALFQPMFDSLIRDLKDQDNENTKAMLISMGKISDRLDKFEIALARALNSENTARKINDKIDNLSARIAKLEAKQSHNGPLPAAEASKTKNIIYKESGPNENMFDLDKILDDLDFD